MNEFEKRCQDCPSLVSIGGVWCCDECFNQQCKDIDDCPEGATVENVKEAESTSNDIMYIDSEKKHTYNRKPNLDRQDLIKAFQTAVMDCGGTNIVVNRVEREFTFIYNDTNYKVVLSAPRDHKNTKRKKSETT